MGEHSGRRYAAFLSYSHKDAADARWLHRRLESYRLPRRLTGSEGQHGPVPGRLTPIFRDREDLPASGDLSETVRAALAVSDNLIVICSPDSAVSTWVPKEIALFRELHPGRPVFAAIVAGDPAECFPPNLPPADGAEPLAADLRPHRDGRRLGFLKLVAGLAGVPLDALVQRDAQRRMRRVMAVTAAAVAAMLIMAVMTTLALNARAEAQHQRAEAEGLVEFMLTDLRDRLKGVVRLDVLTAVNQRALEFYRKQDLSQLPSDSLERRARILHAMGEDDEKRGNLPRALGQFQEAARTTGALLAQRPDDPGRVYDHAQSEFWVGSVAYARRDLATAKAGFERYRALARRLAKLTPSDPRGLQEAGYAGGSLCTIALDQRRPPVETIPLCATALSDMERAAHAYGDSRLDEAVGNRHAWLAEAYLKAGHEAKAEAHFRRQEAILTRLVAGDPKNLEYRDTWLTLQFTFARFESRRGEKDKARSRLSAARELVDHMIAFDPENAVWKRRRARIVSDLNAL